MNNITSSDVRNNIISPSNEFFFFLNQHPNEIRNLTHQNYFIKYILYKLAMFKYDEIQKLIKVIFYSII